MKSMLQWVLVPAVVAAALLFVSPSPAEAHWRVGVAVASPVVAPVVVAPRVAYYPSYATPYYYRAPVVLPAPVVVPPRVVVPAPVRVYRPVVGYPITPYGVVEY